MPPLTTITILVYELIKVNPMTRVLLALRLREGSQASLRKNRQAADKKKSRQQLSDENRRGRHHAHSTAKPFCKMETSTDFGKALAKQAVRHQKSGKF